MSWENKELIDLRSDTVTLPTQEMLEVIRQAKLGDDVYREDPTVKKLEEMAAEKMGKEAALLVTSGTQGNLVSLMSNSKRGDLVFLEAESHIFWYEAGGLSAIAGLLPWLGKRSLRSNQSSRCRSGDKTEKHPFSRAQFDMH